MTDYTQDTIWPSGWNRGDLLPTLLRCQKHAVAVGGDSQAALNRYVDQLQAAAQTNEFLDVALGKLLTSALMHLLAAETQMDDLQKQWVHTAIAYLLAADDAVHDFTTIDGIDDDADVVLALLEALRRADLAQPIRSHLRR